MKKLVVQLNEIQGTRNKLFLRESLVSLVHDKCRNFVGMNNFTKYFWLLNCEDEKVMHELAKFIH